MKNKQSLEKLKKLMRETGFCCMGGAFGVISAAYAITLFGLLAHVGRYVISPYYLENYSLKNRFQTAYRFDVPESERTFYCTNLLDNVVQKRGYLASPYMTYGIISAFGLFGAAWGRQLGRPVPKLKSDFDEMKNNVQNKNNQKIR